MHQKDHVKNMIKNNLIKTYSFIIDEIIGHLGIQQHPCSTIFVLGLHLH